MIRSCLLALSMAMSLSLAASASQIGDLRARYLETVSGIVSLDLQFTLQSNSYTEQGRWARDGERQLLVVRESDFGPGWAAFDGVKGHQVTFDPERPERIREIIASPAVPLRLREAYCIDTWLGTRLKDSRKDLAGLLASASARVVSEDGDNGHKTWVIDLGEHRTPGGRLNHWSVTLAERYGCLPVEMAATPAGEESGAAHATLRDVGTFRYRLSDWIAIPDPLTGGDKWLPQKMESSYKDGGWTLILNSIRLNSSVLDADFRPPAPTVGTQLITETVAGQRTIKVHQQDELLEEYVQQHAARAAEETRRLETEGAAIAVRGDGFPWYALRWAAMGSLIIAAVAYAVRRTRLKANSRE
ncbi:MAG: hypothetical protein ACO3NZ_08160 [Pirellulales bacterium]|jgi:hypothetical protein